MHWLGERNGVWLGLSALFRCCARHPMADALPLLLGAKARNQVRSTPGERLPVRAGWRFGEGRAEGWAESCVAGIKRPAGVWYAPSHGQSLTLCCWVPRPESSAQHAGRAPARWGGLALW